MNKPAQVWIGIAHVQTTPASVVLEGSSGGWVNVLAWAETPEEYRGKVFEAVSFYGLTLRSLEDVEPLQVRLTKASVEPLLRVRAKEVASTKMARFGTFHTYLESS